MWRPPRRKSEFREEDHPRDEGGQFTSGAGSSGGSKEKPGASDKPKEGAGKESGKAGADLLTPEERALPKDAKQPVPPDIGYAGMREKGEVAKRQLQELLDLGKGIGTRLGYKTVEPGTPKEEFEELMSSPGGLVIIGSVKGEKRATEKVESDFGGDWSQLLDIARATIAVDSLEELHRVLGEMRKTGVEFARVPKDRINNPTDVGYRDLLASVKTPSGMIAEVQLHLKPVLEAKKDGHKHYEVMRTIDAKIAAENRPMTAAEAKAYRQAHESSRQLYDAAWQRAMAA